MVRGDICYLPGSERFSTINLVVLAKYCNVTDSQTDGQTG